MPVRDITQWLAEKYGLILSANQLQYMISADASDWPKWRREKRTSVFYEWTYGRLLQLRCHVTVSKDGGKKCAQKCTVDGEMEGLR